MLRFILRRLLQVIPVFLGTTLLVYYMVFALPGDPIAALFGDRQPPQAVIDTLRSQYNLDQPFWVQYGIFLKNLFTFNLGVDFTQQPIAAALGRAFPVTAMLAMARWAHRAGLARPETRSVFSRYDYPALDPAQNRRLLVGGLDDIWTRPDPELPVIGAAAAAGRPS